VFYDCVLALMMVLGAFVLVSGLPVLRCAVGWSQCLQAEHVGKLLTGRLTHPPTLY
jgi:hypothetical protein